jgi:thiol-disulfide isomerase/thioredoxin
MKTLRVWFLLFVWVLDLVCAIRGYADHQPLPSVDLEVFTRAGCPRCAVAAPFLTDLQRERPTLHIRVYDVEEDPVALKRLEELAATYGVQAVGVPAFYLRGTLLIGYRSAETTGMQIQTLLDQGLTQPETETIEAPLFGPLSVYQVGLPLFTVVVGLLDGFNPCAMWVLLFLLSLLVNLRDRVKMLLIGGVFVIVSGVVYFAFMAAWLNIFLLIGFSRVAQVVLGGVAVLIGTLNTKDFFAFGQSVSLAIPAAAKPGLYARVRLILQAEHLAGALTSVTVLAVLVNTIELLCTAGLPAMYTQILTLQQLPWWAFYGYLGLYNVAYMLDDSVLLVIAVVTLGRHKLQEREGRWLKLLSGLVMVGLGIVLLLKPQWLAG